MLWKKDMISAEDRPLVCLSVVFFVTYFVYGASSTSLGAALPSLAEHFHRSETEFGVAFTSRGIGYLFGTLISACILHSSQITLSKAMITSISLLITGISTGIVILSDNFLLAIVCFFIQGIGFGGIDTLANCGLPELWGRRMQPWMQAMHSCFGIGGIVGPALVGAIGFYTTFWIISVASVLPSFLALMNEVSNRPGSAVKSASTGSSSQRGWHGLKDVDIDVQEINTLEVVEFNPVISTNDLPAQEISTESSEENHLIESASKEVEAPLAIRLLVTLFFFVYVGAETGFAGWIPTYVLLIDVTDSKSKVSSLNCSFRSSLDLLQGSSAL